MPEETRAHLAEAIVLAWVTNNYHAAVGIHYMRDVASGQTLLANLYGRALVNSWMTSE
ncbi:hypothetical protein [Streptosporangium amethystogenes]|uniref:hypothetical protein n=1 Tax=Streptosporangium amethystogenes TaxID=2002 RepID=UPI0012FBA466|nr:hypothetical protein [Streptosporangium amethystogenes]